MYSLKTDGQSQLFRLVCLQDQGIFNGRRLRYPDTSIIKYEYLLGN